jgi:hypothetical protein
MDIGIINVDWDLTDGGVEPNSTRSLNLVSNKLIQVHLCGNPTLSMNGQNAMMM